MGLKLISATAKVAARVYFHLDYDDVKKNNGYGCTMSGATFCLTPVYYKGLADYWLVM